jgi:hypothetical protein
MTCSHCGYNVAEGAAACSGCGTPANANQGAGAQQGMPGPAGAMGPAGTMGSAAGAMGSAAGAMGPPPAAAPAFTFDLSRLSRADQIAGGATLVFLISLFLPWFSANVGIYSASVNGLWHGYMYLALLLALAVLAYLVVRASFETMPLRLPVGHEQILLAATAVIFVLTLISFVFKPGSPVGWSIGAFVGLIAAVVAVAPLGVPFLRSRTGR